MSPLATQRLRRGTALAAVLWAVSALVLAIWGQVFAPRVVDPPLITSALGGRAVVTSASAEALAAGVEPGARVLEVDGRPVHQWYQERGWETVRLGTPIHYRIRSADGDVFDVELRPRARAGAYQRFMIPMFAALALVGASYLLVGLLVWRLRPDRAESWAFLLFSSAMATALFSAVHTYDAPLGYERMVMNLPLIGATMFHLFTTFPVEPPGSPSIAAWCSSPMRWRVSSPWPRSWVRAPGAVCSPS